MTLKQYYMTLTVVITSLALLFSDAGAPVSAGQDCFKTSDVKVGMKGIGKTVVSGSKIEEFNVEILGVLKNSKLDDALQISGSSFLIQASGEVIARSGGIAAGMSGSPVYIDGKLVGAVSSGWVMADHSMGLLTPIEDMMTLTKYMSAPKKPVEVNELIDRDAWLFIEKSGRLPQWCNGIEVCSYGDEGTAAKPGMLLFRRAATPLLVSGLNSRSFDVLARSVKKRGLNYKLVDMKGSAADGIDDFNIPDLSPGHAVAAQLVRGDINISAIGTLTYLKDKIFLAFGHSFIKKGNVNFFFSPANIYYCFSSQEMPFKIGSPGKLIGSVKVDRNEGIAGMIGELPHVINVTVNVKDLDSHVKKSFSASVVDDEQMFADLLETVVIQSVDEGINRQGAGFSRVSYSISGKGMKTGEFSVKRKNYYYEEADISTISAEEVTSAVRTLASNPFERIDIFDVTVDVEVTAQDPRAKVGQVSIAKNAIEPGGSLEVTVKIEPVYKKTFVETITIPVPVNLAEGSYNLKISNGYFSPEESFGSADLAEKPGNSLEVRLRKQVASLPDLVKRLNCGEKSNQLKFEFEMVADNADASFEKGFIQHGSKKKDASPFLKEFDIKRDRKEDEQPGGKEKGKDRGKSGERISRRAESEKIASVVRIISSVAERADLFRKEGVSELISALKSELSERRPPSDDDNYKFYRSFEYIVDPFETRFAVTIGEDFASAIGTGPEKIESEPGKNIGGEER